MLELREQERREVSGGDDSGWFTCISAYTPYILGASICSASNGHVYTAIGVGTPGASFNLGYASSLSNYLTGPTVEASAGGLFAGGNTSSFAGGYSEGSPFSASFSYGFDMGSLSDLAASVGNFMSNLMGDIASTLSSFAYGYNPGS